MDFACSDGVLDRAVGFGDVGAVVIFAGAEVGDHFWEVVFQVLGIYAPESDFSDAGGVGDGAAGV